MGRPLVFLLISLICGCASVSVQKYSRDLVYPATRPSGIVIFPQKPAENNFIELGEITVTGANDWMQIEKIFRAKAAEMGADAVYVFNKKEEVKQYVSPDNCYVHGGYYYPYQYFGWHRFRTPYSYPRGYYYCYGYQSTVETTTFISAVGIAIKYTGSTP